MALRKRFRVCRGQPSLFFAKENCTESLCEAVGRNISLTACMFLEWAFLLMAQGERRGL